MEIGFVNFNQEALNRAGKVLKMLQGQGAIDELGLGLIRDAFSNSMFPGLSVLLTHAKYFMRTRTHWNGLKTQKSLRTANPTVTV